MMGRHAESVMQFSVFTSNRVGRLHDLVRLLGSHQVHMLALTVLDATDSAIVRFVLDDPEKGRMLLQDNAFPFAECVVVAVEMDSAEDLNRLLTALLAAEMNVNYLYCFIPHPREKTILALNVEDPEMAEETLKRHQFTVLKQSDISR